MADSVHGSMLDLHFRRVHVTRHLSLYTCATCLQISPPWVKIEKAEINLLTTYTHMYKHESGIVTIV